MAQFPALPVFTDAYLADTRHLSTIQHGAYFLLMMTAWRNDDCALVNDDDYLSKMAGMDKRTWNHNKAVIMSFWRLGPDNKWRQGRLSDERDYLEEQRERNSAAGKASAQKRKNRKSSKLEQTPQLTREMQHFSSEVGTSRTDGDMNNLLKQFVSGSTSVEKRSNGNPTPTPTPTPQYNKPPTPLEDKSVDKSARGSKKLENGKAFDIRHHLSDRDLERAKKAADGWDIYFLIQTYNEGREERGIPDKPVPAFMGWIKKYTKGKQP